MTAITLSILLMAASPAVPRNPEEINFDMGTKDSPLVAGYLRVTPDMAYNVDRGYGFVKLPKAGFDDDPATQAKIRPVPPNEVNPPGPDALRDGVESDGPIAFRANLQFGYYIVSVVVGRLTQPRHDLTVRVYDETLAADLDAWGPFCGVPGGPSVRVLKTIAYAKDGRIIINVDCAKPAADRWKKYTDKAPAGGKLDFLGPNRTDILAVGFRPISKVPIKMKDGKLVTSLKDENIATSVVAYNAGKIDEALAAALSVEKLGLTFPRAIMLNYIIGRVELLDPQTEIQALDECITTFARAGKYAPLSTVIRERLDQNRRYRQALVYLTMPDNEASQKVTGLTAEQRYWAAYGLCDPFHKEDNLYYKSHLVRGRVANWAAAKGGWKHCKKLAQNHFDVFKKAYPDKKFDTAMPAPIAQPAPTPKPASAPASAPAKK